MFRIIYYLSTIVMALLSQPRRLTYQTWLKNTAEVRRDSLVVITLTILIGSFSLFNWKIVSLVIGCVILLNLLVFLFVNARNIYLKKMTK